MSAPRLSVLVVAHNEEAQLADCLERLRFADEIVVVLDKCSDGSKDIAGRYADRLVEGAWEIEGPRRNGGIDACTGDWIHEVDADEWVAPELAAEIRLAIGGAAPGCFQIPFDNYIGDKLVRMAGARRGAWARRHASSPGAPSAGATSASIPASSSRASGTALRRP